MIETNILTIHRGMRWFRRRWRPMSSLVVILLTGSHQLPLNELLTEATSIFRLKQTLRSSLSIKLIFPCTRGKIGKIEQI